MSIVLHNINSIIILNYIRDVRWNKGSFHSNFSTGYCISYLQCNASTMQCKNAVAMESIQCLKRMFTCPTSSCIYREHERLHKKQQQFLWGLNSSLLQWSKADILIILEGSRKQSILSSTKLRNKKNENKKSEEKKKWNRIGQCSVLWVLPNTITFMI